MAKFQLSTLRGGYIGSCYLFLIYLKKEFLNFKKKGQSNKICELGHHHHEETRIQSLGCLPGKISGPTKAPPERVTF